MRAIHVRQEERRDLGPKERGTAEADGESE